MGRKLVPTFCTLLLIYAVGGASARAQERTQEETEFNFQEGDKLPAVQNRLYRLQHEFHVGGGVLPLDPFTKGVTLSGGYGWHINDTWGVEGRFSYLFNMSTHSRDQLEQNFAIDPTHFVQFKYIGELSALFKPIYGKLSALNKSLLFGEIYVSGGAAVARVVGGSDDEYSEIKPQGWKERIGYGGSLGFGLRGYASRYFSLRLDFRGLFIYSQYDWQFPLMITLSGAVSTRTDL